MTDIKDLIERLEAADGADRELDLAVLGAVTAPADGWMIVWPDHLTWNSLDAGHRAPPLTASLDAAVAFAERVLPGWLWSVTTITGSGKPSAMIVAPDHPEGKAVLSWGLHGTPAMSLLIAVLRAMEGGGGGRWLSMASECSSSENINESK